jgi:hypothetical protein
MENRAVIKKSDEVKAEINRLERLALQAVQTSLPEANYIYSVRDIYLSTLRQLLALECVYNGKLEADVAQLSIVLNQDEKSGRSNTRLSPFERNN